MIPESLAGIPSTAAHGAALSARTLHAVADNMTHAYPQLPTVVIHADGTQAYVVGGATLWWVPEHHGRSLTPLAGGVGVTWPL